MSSSSGANKQNPPLASDSSNLFPGHSEAAYRTTSAAMDVSGTTGSTDEASSSASASAAAAAGSSAPAAAQSASSSSSAAAAASSSSSTFSLQSALDASAGSGVGTAGGVSTLSPTGPPLVSDAMPKRLVLKLTTHLMMTYNNINEKYYENKRKRLEAEAAARAAKAKALGGVYNDGNDDKDYNYIVQSHELLAMRYVVDHSIGKGSFGRVVKAFDTLTKRYVAIKIVKSRDAFYKQAQVEMKLLSSLQEEADKWNIVSFVDAFMHKNHQVRNIHTQKRKKENKKAGETWSDIAPVSTDFFSSFLFFVCLFAFAVLCVCVVCCSASCSSSSL